eukprot:872496_1
MEQLVRFRLLSSTLSLDEYRSLLCNVLHDTNMDEISSMIFNHFLTKLRKQNAEQTSNELQMSSINQEISSIISQRKSKQTSDNDNGQDVDTNSESETQTQLPLNITDCAHITSQNAFMIAGLSEEEHKMNIDHPFQT